MDAVGIAFCVTIALLIVLSILKKRSPKKSKTCNNVIQLSEYKHRRKWK